MARAGGSDPDRRFPPLLHAHLLGKKLGGFEVIWDAAGAEPLWAGQPRVKDGVLFFDRMRSLQSLTFLDEYSRYWAKD